jgi:hypothetical protein
MTVGFGGDVVAWPPGQEKIGFLLAFLVRPGHQMILGHVTKIGGEAVCAKEATASSLRIRQPFNWPLSERGVSQGCAARGFSLSKSMYPPGLFKRHVTRKHSISR